MSSIPIFSYKQYLDDMMRLKDNGHVGTGAQVQRPISAGSRGLQRAQGFMDDPVHLMGEDSKKITKSAAINTIAENITYCKESGKLILPEAIKGKARQWFESRWANLTKK
jgi:hypothetical protein